MRFMLRLLVLLGESIVLGHLLLVILVVMLLLLLRLIVLLILLLRIVTAGHRRWQLETV